ncbi:MAG: 16S rRNA (cytosine(1402)-N(4))-methyltransferase RsmH [bacterium]|nr:16S rRNA (cytosine(1402)-N(4))-methyltransferase RsmH [bacterium]
MQHIPVLLEEVMKFFEPFSGGRFIDATVGYGGHAFAILERISGSKVLGIDADASALAFCEEERKRRNISSDRLILRQGNFRMIDALVKESDFAQVEGILFDFGMSSGELDTAERGFSFMKEGVLDMRFDQRSGMTALDIVNQWPETALEKIIREYGEERQARRIAQAIAVERKRQTITTTTTLAELIARLPGMRQGRIHPATRTFQALRIVVNDELGAIRETLSKALTILQPKGRMVTIAFHSLEDRIVKEFAKEMARVEKRMQILTKHVLQASREEEKSNPRSRSAKLRAMEKI